MESRTRALLKSKADLLTFPRLFQVSAAILRFGGFEGTAATAVHKSAKVSALPLSVGPTSAASHQRMKRSNSVGSRRDNGLENGTTRPSNVRVLRRHHSTFVTRRVPGSSPPLPPVPQLSSGDSPDSASYLPRYSLAPALDMPSFEGLGIALEQNLVLNETPKSRAASRRESAVIGLSGSTDSSYTAVAVAPFAETQLLRIKPRTASSARPISTATLEITMPGTTGYVDVPPTTIARLPASETRESSPLRESRTLVAVPRRSENSAKRTTWAVPSTASQFTRLETSSSTAAAAVQTMAEAPGPDMSKFCLRPTVNAETQTPGSWPAQGPVVSLPKAIVSSATPPQAYTSFSAALAVADDQLAPPPPPASTKYITAPMPSPSLYSVVSPGAASLARFPERPDLYRVLEESVVPRSAAITGLEAPSPRLQYTPTAQSYARMPSSPSPPTEYVSEFRRASLGTPYHPASTSSNARRSSMFAIERTIRPTTVYQTHSEELPKLGLKHKPSTERPTFTTQNPFSAPNVGDARSMVRNQTEAIAPEDEHPLPSPPADESDLVSTIRRASIVSTHASSAIRRASLVRVSACSCSPRPGSTRSSVSSASSASSNEGNRPTRTRYYSVPDVAPAVPPVPPSYRRYSHFSPTSPVLDSIVPSRTPVAAVAERERRSSEPSPAFATPRLRGSISVTAADRLSKSRSFFLVQALENQQRRASLALEAKAAKDSTGSVDIEAVGDAVESDDNDDESLLNDALSVSEVASVGA